MKAQRLDVNGREWRQMPRTKLDWVGLDWIVTVFSASVPAPVRFNDHDVYENDEDDDR